ncbi:LysE family translocator [Marinimicrobium sp. ABcell2]|uniref:LysE family translocator n=1 Tax=Marinimicrobium sp. ABcell2 TaxID=3069751 RepID=UPI0027B4246F|nr:LysE family translocator [Marinimicrobium sp. ABcell2]MDQ2076393.1 LysE family translocator [Marinimicrobium sp. ABcell2]
MEYLISLMVFTFVASVTPGPNNIMLFASGINHGVKKSLPHYFGICIGFLLLVAAVGFGLGALFKQSPFLHQVLKIAGALYLVYFAWKIGSASSASDGSEIRSPITFFEAALFQWVNPKAWIIAIGAIATFTIQSSIAASIAAIIVMYFFMGSLAMGIWLTSGASLQRLLNSDKRRRAFNVSMAVLLLLSIIPIVSVPIN